MNKHRQDLAIYAQETGAYWFWKASICKSAVMKEHLMKMSATEYAYARYIMGVDEYE